MSKESVGKVTKRATAWENIDEEENACEKCEACGKWFQYDTMHTDSEGYYLCTNDFNELLKDQNP